MRKRINQKSCLAILVFLILLGLGASAAAGTIYVDDDATGANDGSSWENAYNYLQDALADANSAEKPVEIRVAQGIYKPDQGANQIPGYREATFQLINGVTVRGGYAGFREPNPNARDVELYQTILNGDLADNDAPIDNPHELYKDPSRADNSIRVVTATITDPNTLLEGTVVTGAFYYFPEEPDYIGAGLYASTNANVTVRSCVFTSNAGPGIRSEGSNCIIEDCIFRNNTAGTRGGGICIRYGSAHISRCTFEDNWASDGGGLFNEGGRLWLENCTFTRNVASGLQYADVGYGGGLHIESHLVGSKIDNCIFIANIASVGGGAHFGYRGMVLPLSRGEKTLLTGCSFVLNQASWGGAIGQSTSTLDIEHCVFRENSALYTGGAISTLSSITNLANCIFSGNSASLEGASILARGSQEVTIHDHEWPQDFVLTLDSCTLRGNRTAIGQSLACRSHDSEDLDSTFISNCILHNNGNEIHNPDGSHITISYTNLRGGVSSVHDPCEAVIWGEGNIDADPCFAVPGYWIDVNDPNVAVEPNDPNAVWVNGDYHLKSQAGRWDSSSASWVKDDVTSPCIDAGDPSSPIGFEPFPNGGIINMGAYGGTAEASKSYFGEPPCGVIVAGDINGDCKVDFNDFALMAAHWLKDT